MNKRLAFVILLLAVGGSTLAYIGRTITNKLEVKYLSVLDGWVARGGKAQEYQDNVLGTCGKLIMVGSSASEVISFWTARNGEFDFRANVCVKTTVHRVLQQPELNDQELVREICDDAKVPMLEKLCRRSGLR